MAPILEQDLEEPIKRTIQDLYELQSSIHGYLGPQTTAVLISKIHDLTASLSHLSSLSLAAPSISNNSPPNDPIMIPPEIIGYVDNGRNPDIYTREFVELVQRSNMFLKGKAEAFRGFRDVLAEEMVGAGVLGVGEVRGVVEGVVGGGVKEEGEGEGGFKMEEGEG